MIVMQNTIDVVRMYAGICGTSRSVAFSVVVVAAAVVDNELSAWLIIDAKDTLSTDTPNSSPEWGCWITSDTFSFNWVMMVMLKATATVKLTIW